MISSILTRPVRGMSSAEPLSPGAFERISPSRFVSFTFPNPLPQHANPYPTFLRVAVLDSPNPNAKQDPYPQTAAMLVPIGRHHDWIFSTHPGHLHLLLSSNPLSRLILIGEPVSGPEPEPKPYTRPAHDPDPIARLQHSLLPLLLALSPRSSFRNGEIPEVPFLSYEDDLASISPVEFLMGPTAGEMLVEDVELDCGERRRRLRFKRVPNLVQSQVRLVPHGSNPAAFRPETGSLVQPYLAPMVAGLSLLPLVTCSMPKAICIGVGGGPLLMCLRYTFGFHVLGVEADEIVVSVAKKHFGLVEDEWLQVCVGDGIKLIENGTFVDGFDVIMVDLDSVDDLNGIGAPPVEFVSTRVLLGLRSALRQNGIVVVNVIKPLDGCFYERLVSAFREVFADVNEIDVGNGENYVLIATVLSTRFVGYERHSAFSGKLKQVGAEEYVHCMKRI